MTHSFNGHELNICICPHDEDVHEYYLLVAIMYHVEKCPLYKGCSHCTHTDQPFAFYDTLITLSTPIYTTY